MIFVVNCCYYSRCSELNIQNTMSMDDSGFEEDHVALLAELTSQALLHQPISLDLDPMSSLETLVAAAENSSLPTASSAFLYGFLVCVQETLRYLTEVERLPPAHPIVCSMFAHLLNEYVNISTRLCAEASAALGGSLRPGQIDGPAVAPDPIARLLSAPDYAPPSQCLDKSSSKTVPHQ